MSKLNQVAHNIERQIILITTAILLTVFPIPVIFSLLILSIILRLIVGVVARIFRPDLAGFVYGRRITIALDSIYKKPKLTILLHFVLDGSVPLDKIRLAFQQNILSRVNESGNLEYLHLRQTWTQFLGFLFWKWDKDFSLSHHIRNYDYHQDKNLVLPDICTESDLKRVTADLISKPYKEGTSPWEMLVIPRYVAADNTSGKKQFVVVFRVHHGLADGYSILRLMFKAFNLEAAKVPQPSFPKLSSLSRICRGVVMPFRLPYDVASQFVDGFNWSNLWHLFNKKYSGEYYAFFSDRIAVDKIKEIKNKYGVSYNVATYAIAIGGIRRLMMEAGQRVPKSMSCLVPFPLPEHPGGLVNHASALIFQVSGQIHCPADRIREISKNTRVFNNASAVPIYLSWTLDLLALLPVFVVKLIHSKIMITLALSSFQGPEYELDTLGTAKLVDIITSIGHISCILGAVGALVSFSGKQRFVVTIDRALFESGHIPVNFARHIDDEVNDLLL